MEKSNLFQRLFNPTRVPRKKKKALKKEYSHWDGFLIIEGLGKQQYRIHFCK